MYQSVLDCGEESGRWQWAPAHARGCASLNLSAHEKIGSELVSTDERPPVSTAGTMGTVQAVYVLQSRRIQSRGRLQLGEHGNHKADMPDWCDLHRPYQVAQFDL